MMIALNFDILFREPILLIVLEQLRVYLFLDLVGHEILQFPPKHRQLANSRRRYVHARATRHEENCFLPTQLSIYDTH